MNTYDFLSFQISKELKESDFCQATNTITLLSGAKEPILTLLHGNWVLKTAKFRSFTDDYDTLVEESKQNIFRLSARDTHGSVFFLENYENNEAVFIASEAPEFVDTVLKIKRGEVTVENGGNPITVGFAELGKFEEFCRGYFRSHCQYKIPITMSNTWGDCNGFDRVCESFVLKEIAAAEEMGIDTMQIDDGWQKGNTADPSIFDEARHRAFKGDFWELSKERFPGGMKLVTDTAKNAGIKIGLWFAPDSHDDYAFLERDLSVLERAYREWGVRFFKLDMYWINTKEERDRFLKLIKGIYAFGDDVSVELDVTRDIRVNYLFCKEYGTVFVENRYLKLATYAPYRTLRNLWSIGRYLPTFRFQFELANPDLYPEMYRDEDPFAPSKYDMDYLFASVMVSSPLFWMELQHLSEKRKAELAPLMKIWREIRKDLADADIIPIGDEPTGRSFTGFHIKRPHGRSYLLLLREVNDISSFDYKIDTCAKSSKIMISNADSKISLGQGILHAEFSKARAYILAEIE